MPSYTVPLASLALLSCGGSTPARNADTAPAVRIHGGGAGSVRVRVELAATPQERARGLMYRQKLDEDSGMLFLFERPAVQSFWMKNTLIPLDMIFIGDDLRIVGVVENAEPMTLIPRTVGVPSRYVLEVNGGFVARHGVTAGATVEFIHVPEGGIR